MKKKLHIQTLLFDRTIWSERSACQWARSHGHMYDKIHTTHNKIRLRQFNPNQFKTDSFVTIQFGHGIEAIMGHLR